MKPISVIFIFIFNVLQFSVQRHTTKSTNSTHRLRNKRLSTLSTLSIVYLLNYQPFDKARARGGKKATRALFDIQLARISERMGVLKTEDTPLASISRVLPEGSPRGLFAPRFFSVHGVFLRGFRFDRGCLESIIGACMPAKGGPAVAHRHCGEEVRS